MYCKYLIARTGSPPPSRPYGNGRAERNKASSTSDDPARAKRPILGCCWQTKKKTWKVLNCHSKMRPLDTEKDVQTKAQPRSYPASYIPGCIDCTHIYIYIEIGTREWKVLRRSARTSVVPITEQPRARESETEKITPSARVSVLTRPSAICRLWKNTTLIIYQLHSTLFCIYNNTVHNGEGGTTKNVGEKVLLFLCVLMYISCRCRGIYSEMYSLSIVVSCIWNKPIWILFYSWPA